MSDYYITLMYNGIKKNIKIPENYSELKKAFLTEFKEDNKCKYCFDYNTIKNKKINFEDLKIDTRNNNYPIINIYKKQFSNPKNIQIVKEIAYSSYSNGLNNTFIIIKSIFGKIILIYSGKNQSIISYDLILEQRINYFKNAHSSEITFFNHTIDKKNKRDLILSISKKDLVLKLWNYNNFCLLNVFDNIFQYGELHSACFLNDNNEIYIVAGSFYKDIDEIEPIKIYNLDGYIKKTLDDSQNDIYYIDIFYDIKFDTIYIITSNFGYVKSYNYYKNKVYYKYSEYDIWGHKSFEISNNKDIVKLIETSGEGVIRIWNFHTSELLIKIEVHNTSLYLENKTKPLFCSCLWNDKIFFASYNKKILILIDITNGKLIMTETSFKNNIKSFKKIYLPKYGECLISQEEQIGQIKIWKNFK